MCWNNNSPDSSAMDWWEPAETVCCFQFPAWSCLLSTEFGFRRYCFRFAIPKQPGCQIWDARRDPDWIAAESAGDFSDGDCSNVLNIIVLCSVDRNGGGNTEDHSDRCQTCLCRSSFRDSWLQTVRKKEVFAAAEEGKKFPFSSFRFEDNRHTG